MPLAKCGFEVAEDGAERVKKEVNERSGWAVKNKCSELKKVVDAAN